MYNVFWKNGGVILSDKVYDITVIGAGPAGLFTAFYGGMRQASVKIIESLPHIGGQLSALYPEKYIYDVAGFAKISAQELVENLEKQLELFDPTIVLNEPVDKVDRLEQLLGQKVLIVFQDCQQVLEKQLELFD